MTVLGALRLALIAAIRAYRLAYTPLRLEAGEPFGSTPEARALWQASQCLRRMSKQEPPRC